MHCYDIIQVCTAVSCYGDTALTTLVHNPRCMAALETAARRNVIPASKTGLLPHTHTHMHAQ